MDSIRPSLEHFAVLGSAHFAPHELEMGSLMMFDAGFLFLTLSLLRLIFRRPERALLPAQLLTLLALSDAQPRTPSGFLSAADR